MPVKQTLSAILEQFADAPGRKEKGALCVALVVTRHAKKHGLPLDPSSLLTQSGGQVAGLGKRAVQSILAGHKITRVLAEEGGRTSRGSVGNMKDYVQFLNDLHKRKLANLPKIENWWIERVKEYFAAKPFTLRLDPASSIRAVIRDLLDQADKRQRKAGGTMYVGTVLQHLVGAKLELLLPKAKIAHHGASVADGPSQRNSDFLIEDVAIHVTVTPGEALVRKCKSNLESGFRPLIITTQRAIPVIDGLAEQAGISARIEVFDAEQFLAGNLYELGKFTKQGRRDTAGDLVDKYNQIVDSAETDPGLRIDVLK